MKKFFTMLAMVALIVSVLPAPSWAVTGKSGPWDETSLETFVQVAKGSGATYTLLSAGAVTDGTTYVEISAANHLFYTGSQITIAGSTAYNGTHTITSVTAGAFRIKHKYTAETMAGTETVGVSLKPPVDFQLLRFNIVCDTAPATAETLTITVDSSSWAAFDPDLFTIAMAGTKTYFKTWDVDDYVRFLVGDEIDFRWVNTDARVWTIEIYWRKKK